MIALLTGQSVPILVCVRMGRSNAIPALFMSGDPAYPDLNCGTRLASVSELPYRGSDAFTAYRGLSCRPGLQELTQNSAGPLSRCP